jgi:glycopeptide antibiotics resistance protein
VDAVSRQVKSAEVVVRGEQAPAPKSSPTFGRLSSEDVGNILLFVPFGLLVPLRFAWLRWWTVPAGCALSGAIELTQLLVLSHRTAQWHDWVWNTTGAAVGFALYLVVSLAWRGLGPRPVDALR